jgi:EmrB/QacA subfamily drug resistance transporter
VLYTVAIGSLVMALDSSVLMVCLPGLGNVFQVDPSVIAWVNVAFLLTTQGLMLPLAQVGDVFGRKRMYVAGLSVYTVGLLLCALSHNVSQLIVFRGIQGIGGGATFALSMAIAVAVFPPSERGRALGILAAAHSIGLVAGPALGGFIMDLLGWRAVFYARLPISIGGILLALVIVKEQKRAGSGFRFDISGAVTLALWVTGFLLLFNLGGKWGYQSPDVLMLAGLTALLFALFLGFEKKASQPIIDLKLFATPLFTAHLIVGLIYAVTAVQAVFLTPFYLIEGLKYEATAVGVYLAILAVPTVIVTPLSGRVCDRMGTRFPAVVGMSFTCLALFLLSRLDSQSASWEIAAKLALFGVGVGILNPANSSSVVGSVSRDKLGTASAMLSTAKQFGIATGVAMGGTMLSSRQMVHLARLSASGVDPSLGKELSVIRGFQDTLTVAACLCVLGIFACLVKDRRPRKLY